jgi:hypothetical protein
MSCLLVLEGKYMSCQSEELQYFSEDRLSDNSCDIERKEAADVAFVG